MKTNLVERKVLQEQIRTLKQVTKVKSESNLRLIIIRQAMLESNEQSLKNIQVIIKIYGE